MEEDHSKKKRRGWRKWFFELFTKCFACCCGPLKRFLWGEAQSDDYAHFIDDDLERGVTATPNVRERTLSTNKTYSPPHPPLPTPKKKDTTSVNLHSTTILQEPPIQSKSMYSSQEIEDESSSMISNSTYGTKSIYESALGSSLMESASDSFTKSVYFDAEDGNDLKQSNT